MITILAAATMAMLAPDAAKAQQCATHYTAVGAMMLFTVADNDASEADKDAAIAKATPWLARADKVLVDSGVKNAEDDVPDEIAEKAVNLLTDIGEKKTSAESLILTIASCDSDYGLEPLDI